LSIDLTYATLVCVLGWARGLPVSLDPTVLRWYICAILASGGTRPVGAMPQIAERLAGHGMIIADQISLWKTGGVIR
jgi:hypothetical protein